jgi:hypothetical protein
VFPLYRLTIYSMKALTTLPPLDYSFQCAPSTSGRGPDGAVGAEWPAYPQASYANQSKVDATAGNDWIFAPAHQSCLLSLVSCLLSLGRAGAGRGEEGCASTAALWLSSSKGTIVQRGKSASFGHVLVGANHNG